MKLSEDTKKKISDKKSIAIICIETQEVFRSITEAAKKMNLNRTGICNVLSGRNKTTKGYTFKYLDSYDSSCSEYISD